MSRLDERLESLATSLAEPVDQDQVLERLKSRADRHRRMTRVKPALVFVAALLAISLALLPLWRLRKEGPSSPRSPSSTSPSASASPSTPFAFHGSLLVSGRPAGSNDGGSQYIVTGLDSLQELSIDGGARSWSPDGTRLALSRITSESPKGELVIHDLLTGAETIVTKHDVPFDPAWSPLGDLIAFSTQHGEIYTVHVDGTGLQRVTQPPGSSCGDGFPAWAPDGAAIVFARSCDDPAEGGLFTVHPDGTGLVRVAAPWMATPPREAMAAAWSPDRRTIAYQSRDMTNLAFSIYEVDPNGENEHLLIADAGSPSWEPQGTALAIVQAGRIVIIDSDGQVLQTIPATDGLEVWTVTWGP